MAVEQNAQMLIRRRALAGVVVGAMAMGWAGCSGDAPPPGGATCSGSCADASVTPADGGAADTGLPPIGNPDAEADAVSAADAAPDAAADGSPRPCDGTKLPSEDPCVLDEAYGFFVSASRGRDGGLGTKADPIKAVAEGLAKAKAFKKRLYVCAEDYAGPLVVENGISMFGGVSCAGGVWAWSTARARISASGAPALQANSIASPTTLQGFTFSTADASPVQPGSSSIGVQAVASPQLTLRDSAILAGKGSDGSGAADALSVKNNRSPQEMQGGANFANTQCDTRARTYPVCVNAADGGQAGQTDCRDANGGVLDPSMLGEAGTAGGTGGVCQKVFTPQPINECRPTTDTIPPGTSGAGPLHGSAGANGGSIGGFTSSVYSPAGGEPGTNGRGGGGGRGAPGTYPMKPIPTDPYVMTGSGGSGGGAGGCGGYGGKPGTGGGASIGILTWDSPVQLIAVTITTSTGGAGGAGGFGSPGTPGGLPGPNDAGTEGKAGGAGGDGGRGGNGGSGGGGPSIGIAHKGGLPSMDAATTITVGAGGAGAPKRTKAGLPDIPASPQGRSEKTYLIP